MVQGHPFKGGMTASTGQLLHPDLKRFQINYYGYFQPPRPGARPGDVQEAPHNYANAEEVLTEKLGNIW